MEYKFLVIIQIIILLSVLVALAVLLTKKIRRNNEKYKNEKYEPMNRKKYVLFGIVGITAFCIIIHYVFYGKPSKIIDSEIDLPIFNIHEWFVFGINFIISSIYNYIMLRKEEFKEKKIVLIICIIMLYVIPTLLAVSYLYFNCIVNNNIKYIV